VITHGLSGGRTPGLLGRIGRGAAALPDIAWSAWGWQQRYVGGTSDIHRTSVL